MGMTCSTNKSKLEMDTNFWHKNVKERKYLGDLRAGDALILR
jgi:hypothetical protein